MRKKLQFLFLTLMGVMCSGSAWGQKSIGEEFTVGATKYRVKGSNLFTNGSFSDGVNGWKTVGYTTAADASNFTLTQTGGYDDGAYITTSAAGAGAATSIRQAIAVESGKMYYFCVYTSGKAPSASNFSYNALFQLTDATTENGVLKAFEWPQGAGNTATTWSKTEYVFTPAEGNPYVSVRMSWNSSTSFDGFGLYEVESLGFAGLFAEGDYFIQNVESGAFLGGGNDYGTHASLLGKPQIFTLASKSENSYTLDSHQYNNATDHYLTTGLYVDGGATEWTFTETATPNVYTISNDGNYIAGNGVNAVITTVTEASAASAQWKLITIDDVKALQSSATIESPVDVTYFIKNPELKRNANTSWYPTWTITGSNGEGTPANYSQGQNGNVANCFESYHSSNGFKVLQTISGLKAGVYRLDAQAFYRQDGSNYDNLPYVFLNDQISLFPLKTGSENSMVTAYSSFLAKTYPITPLYIRVETDGSFDIGACCTNTATWNIFGEFGLLYYGDVTVAEVQLADYVKQYNEAMYNAKAYQTQDMFTEDKTDLNNAITANTVNLSTATQETLETAITNLNAATEAAKAAVLKYSQYSNAQTLIGTGDAEADLTSLIVNNGFESNTLDGWKNDGSIAVSTQGNKAFDNTQGNYYAEKWHVLGTINVNQTLGTLPKGFYQVSAYIYSEPSDGKLYANNDSVSVGKSQLYSVLTEVEDRGSLKFGASCTLTGNTWFCMDEFTLKYVVDLPYTLASGYMSASAAQAQTDAETALNSEKNMANYRALLKAIEDANASIAVYAKYKKVLEYVESLTQSGKNKFNELASATVTAYNNRTIDNEDALEEFYASLRAASLAQTEDGAEFTYGLVNPSFEEGTNGWTNTRNTTGSYDYRTDQINPADGTKHLNAWAPQVNYIHVFQKVVLPAGHYTLSAKARADAEPLENQTQVRAYINGVMQSASQGLTYTAPTEEGHYWNDADMWITLTTTFDIAEETEVEMGIYSKGKNLNGNTQGWFQVDDFRLIRNSAPTATMTIAEANKWATFYAPFDVDVPANVYSYAITVDGSNNAVRSKIGGDAAYTLPANTPVLVYTDNAGGYTNTFVAGAATGNPETQPESNYLVGTAVAINVPASVEYETTNYVLQNPGDGVQWLTVNNNTLPANRAYLSVSATVNVKNIFNFDDATEISNLAESVADSQQPMFNLAGQAVGKDYKGVIIRNGKKYLSK